MWNAWKLLPILALCTISFGAPAMAGVPKVIFSDEFGYAA
jgi:hypothetical protein